MAAVRVMVLAAAGLLLLAGFVSVDSVKSRRQTGYEKQHNFFRQTAINVYWSLAAVFGEENVEAVQKFFSRITEQFVFGMDVLVHTVWKIWTDLLDVLGIDGSNLNQYLNPSTAINHPTQVLLLVVAVLIAYCSLSMFIGFIFYTLRTLFGCFFWIARIVFYALACIYILQKSEGDPEGAVLPLCIVVLTYITTGPVGFYWRRSVSHVEEKLDHLDGQIRLMNIRLSRVLEKLDQSTV
ncbi:BRI3-binding protein [Scyliorhinus canicula]|uniref:BRI3-binding protein n=1 Tax=Scyliorhinus canicula TaxID=7830 RepID=UPI0018F44D2D|nr:BRI3-binding protein [Scyliorhinus canicula]